MLDRGMLSALAGKLRHRATQGPAQRQNCIRTHSLPATNQEALLSLEL